MQRLQVPLRDERIVKGDVHMSRSTVNSALAAIALAGACVTVGAPTATGVTTSEPLGHRSLATVLAEDGNVFDENWRDFDIADKLIHDVLSAKPDSPVAIVKHGRERVTVFLPTDSAFRKMAKFFTGKRLESEQRVYRALRRAAGTIGNVENVLLTHPVDGKTLNYRRLKADAPTTLTSMQGAPLKTRFRDGKLLVVDWDKFSPRARVIPELRNINKGNLQIAHGITSVLSPDKTT